MEDDKGNSRLHALLVVCAWCKTPLETKWVPEKPIDDTSHGLCGECYDKEMQKLDEDLDGPKSSDPT